MDWRIKGIVQKALSVVPGGERINDLLQRTLGGLRNFGATVDGKVDDWAIHMGHLRELDVPLAGKVVLEIGTGWFPTFPLCYALAGTERCLTFDLSRHLDARLTFKLLGELERHLEPIATATRSSLDDVRARYAKLTASGDLVTLLGASGIEYFAPADATATALASDSVDIVFSNSVLEHVQPEVLDELMRESRRLLRPGGLIVHSINCGDHYAYFDRSINFMNYLQFSDAQWALWNNDLQYQNRLRPKHFVAATEAAELDVVIRKFTPRPDLLAALPKMRLAAEFAHYSPEQLASKSIDIVARKRP